MIVAYARPDGVERLLNICRSAGVRRIYIAIDGPRDHRISQKQSTMLSIIHGFQNHQTMDIQVWHRNHNLGVAVSVITAIDWFFKRENSGLVLEDDLIPSLDFFAFASKGLEKFEFNEKVWMICGSRMLPTTRNCLETDWSHYPMIWGWATWKSRWSVMRKTFSQKDLAQKMNFYNARHNFWYVGSSRAKSGEIDTWDIPLAFAQWSQSKFSIIPPVNLVTNVGFDSEGTHTSGDAYPLSHPTDFLPSAYSFSEQPSFSSSHSYDILLEDKLFGIRPRHRFLRLYSSLTKVVKNRSNRLGDLSGRLSQVAIPD